MSMSDIANIKIDVDAHLCSKIGLDNSESYNSYNYAVGLWRPGLVATSSSRLL